jgi:hypothetical protein
VASFWAEANDGLARTESIRKNRVPGFLIPSQVRRPVQPGPFELAELARQVAKDWAFLSASPIGAPAPGPAALPLEFSVRLSGPLDYLLVVRGGWDLAAELAESSTGDPSARDQAGDAFRELVNLLAGRLATRYLASSESPFGPFLPKATRPDSWPGRAPDTAAAVMVERFPLELRLWTLGQASGTP